jgi:replicative DNA helicase
MLRKMSERSFDMGKKIGISTGLDELDSLTSGFQGPELVIIGARPSLGKTALALSMAAHISITNSIPTAFFSLEMAKEALIVRLLSSGTKINHEKIRSGSLSDDDKEKVKSFEEKLGKAPLFIFDSPNTSILEIKTHICQLHSDNKVDIVFIDYLGLIGHENTALPRNEQIAEISKTLKQLSRELTISIVVLTQLTRDAGQIRDSGSIEQDADLIMFLERERDQDQKAREATIRIAKQSNGPTGTVNLTFDPEYAR